MVNKLHMILDSIQIDLKSPHNFTLQLGTYDIQNYTRIRLKHIFLYHETDVRRLFRSGAIMPIYVHCSLLNKDDNVVNGKKSDVISAIYLDNMKPKRLLGQKFENDSGKLLKYDTNINMCLTTSDGVSVEGRGRFGVVYQLEFSQ